MFFPSLLPSLNYIFIHSISGMNKGMPLSILPSPYFFLLSSFLSHFYANRGQRDREKENGSWILHKLYAAHLSLPQGLPLLLTFMTPYRKFSIT